MLVKRFKPLYKCHCQYCESDGDFRIKKVTEVKDNHGPDISLCRKCFNKSKYIYESRWQVFCRLFKKKRGRHGKKTN